MEKDMRSDPTTSPGAENYRNELMIYAKHADICPDMSIHQKPSNPQGAGAEFETGDTRLNITQAIVDLHVARRTLLIYPITHEQVKRSIVRAYNGLNAIITTDEGVTLAVMKACISVGDHALGARNPVLKDLAEVLKYYQIATVTFNKGLHVKELARFLQLICFDRDKIIAKGGMAAAAQERNFTSIQIQTVDYSKLLLTEEQEIRRSSGEGADQGSVWQHFVSNLMSTRTNRNLSVGPHVDPGQLADLLNRQALDVQQVIGHYTSTLTRTQASGSDDTASAKELLAFQQLIKELDAKLKMQFLSATFDNCGRIATLSDAARLIDGLGGDLIIQMIRQANSQGKEISPSLLAFIKKMGHADDPEGNLIGAEADKGNSKKLSSQNVKSLLAREAYDTYVDTDYQTLLDNLTGDAQAADQDAATRSLAQEIEADLTHGGIHIHTGRAITRLMIQSADVSGYRDWARQLTYLLDDLLDSHAYHYLTQLMIVMRREKQKNDKNRSEIAGLVLDRFSDPQFVAKAIENFQTSMGETETEALVFLMELGEPVVVEIFDGLDPCQTFHEQDALTQILQNLAKFTAKEALERLKDPNPEYVGRMIRIIRKMGDSESAQQIRSMMDHKDLNVRMEALATLLKFKNKWGEVRLRDLLGDPLGDAFTRAVRLAGRYRVRAAVPQLEAIAIQRGAGASREAAIRALGRIGDPGAITTLSKIARRRWSITQKYNLHLKRVIFDTLGGYPGSAIQNLLRYGLKQKDEAIQEACRQLLRKGGQTAIQSAS